MTFDIDRLSHLLSVTGEIDFAFLLGSARDGEVKEGSDIDVAVMFSPGVSADYNVMARLFSIVDEVASGKECDLIRLNTASETVCFEALKGRLLFVTDDAMERYADFYSMTCRAYEDYRAWSLRQLEYRKEVSP
jgi:predicted nucleotidyltransferase